MTNAHTKLAKEWTCVSNFDNVLCAKYGREKKYEKSFGEAGLEWNFIESIKRETMDQHVDPKSKENPPVTDMNYSLTHFVPSSDVWVAGGLSWCNFAEIKYLRVHVSSRLPQTVLLPRLRQTSWKSNFWWSTLNALTRSNMIFTRVIRLHDTLSLLFPLWSQRD